MKKLSKLILLLTASVLTIILAEFLLKTFIPNLNQEIIWTSGNIYRLDNDLIYSRIPYSESTWKTDEYTEKVKANNYGYRDNYLGKKENHTFRIIAVGDSFTFGHGIKKNEDTYPAQLELYLNKMNKDTKKIQVINAAEKGYSPDQEYRLIEKELLNLEPDMIIWNFSIPEDFYNLVHNPSWPIPALYDIKDNQLVSLNAKTNWLYVSNFLIKKFTFLSKSYLFNNIVRISSSIRFLNNKPYLADDDMFDWAISKMIAEVTSAQNLIRQKNIKLVIVLLPFKENFNNDFPSTRLGKYTEKFKEKIMENSLPLIDIREEIKNNKYNYTDLYYKEDVHPNNIGTRIFASIVGEKIIGKIK